MEKPRAPKMVLFDFGGTLAEEPEADGPRGCEALLRHCVKNPLGLNAQVLFREAAALWEALGEPARHADREIHEYQFLRLHDELLGMEYSIPPQQQELLFWEAFTPLVPMPHIEALLALLDVLGIRKGVVSNIGFSGETLTARLAQALPAQAFEFVIASSDYGVRKPDPLIFKLALAKANLSPEDIWFCGDNLRCDVEGAHAAGMRPVWYEPLAAKGPSNRSPQCPHLHIHDWQELIQILKEIT